MTTEDAALRITHHIRAGFQLTANQPEVERGMYLEKSVLDAVNICDLRMLLQLYVSHATSAEIHKQVQRLFISAIREVAIAEAV